MLDYTPDQLKSLQFLSWKTALLSVLMELVSGKMRFVYVILHFAK